MFPDICKILSPITSTRLLTIHRVTKKGDNFAFFLQRIFSNLKIFLFLNRKSLIDKVFSYLYLLSVYIHFTRYMYTLSYRTLAHNVISKADSLRLTNLDLRTSPGISYVLRKGGNYLSKIRISCLIITRKILFLS